MLFIDSSKSLNILNFKRENFSNKFYISLKYDNLSLIRNSDMDLSLNSNLSGFSSKRFVNFNLYDYKKRLFFIASDNLVGHISSAYRDYDNNVKFLLDLGYSMQRIFLGANCLNKRVDNHATYANRLFDQYLADRMEYLPVSYKRDVKSFAFFESNYLNRHIIDYKFLSMRTLKLFDYNDVFDVMEEDAFFTQKLGAAFSRYGVKFNTLILKDSFDELHKTHVFEEGFTRGYDCLLDEDFYKTVVDKGDTGLFYNLNYNSLYLYFDNIQKYRLNSLRNHILFEDVYPIFEYGDGYYKDDTLYVKVLYDKKTVFKLFNKDSSDFFFVNNVFSSLLNLKMNYNLLFKSDYNFLANFSLNIKGSSYYSQDILIQKIYLYYSYYKFYILHNDLKTSLNNTKILLNVLNLNYFFKICKQFFFKKVYDIFHINITRSFYLCNSFYNLFLFEPYLNLLYLTYVPSVNSLLLYMYKGFLNKAVGVLDMFVHKPIKRKDVANFFIRLNMYKNFYISSLKSYKKLFIHNYRGYHWNRRYLPLFVNKRFRYSNASKKKKLYFRRAFKQDILDLGYSLFYISEKYPAVLEKTQSFSYLYQMANSSLFQKEILHLPKRYSLISKTHLSAPDMYTFGSYIKAKRKRRFFLLKRRKFGKYFNKYRFNHLRNFIDISKNINSCIGEKDSNVSYSLINILRFFYFYDFLRFGLSCSYLNDIADTQSLQTLQYLSYTYLIKNLSLIHTTQYSGNFFDVFYKLKNQLDFYHLAKRISVRILFKLIIFFRSLNLNLTLKKQFLCFFFEHYLLDKNNIFLMGHRSFWYLSSVFNFNKFGSLQVIAPDTFNLKKYLLKSELESFTFNSKYNYYKKKHYLSKHFLINNAFFYNNYIKKINYVFSEKSCKHLNFYSYFLYSKLLERRAFVNGKRSEIRNVLRSYLLLLKYQTKFFLTKNLLTNFKKSSFKKFFFYLKKKYLNLFIYSNKFKYEDTLFYKKKRHKYLLFLEKNLLKNLQSFNRRFLFIRRGLYFFYKKYILSLNNNLYLNKKSLYKRSKKDFLFKYKNNLFLKKNKLLISLKNKKNSCSRKYIFNLLKEIYSFKNKFFLTKGFSINNSFKNYSFCKTVYRRRKRNILKKKRRNLFFFKSCNVSKVPFFLLKDFDKMSLVKYFIFLNKQKKVNKLRKKKKVSFFFRRKLTKKRQRFVKGNFNSFIKLRCREYRRIRKFAFLKFFYNPLLFEKKKYLGKKRIFTQTYKYFLAKKKKRGYYKKSLFRFFGMKRQLKRYFVWGDYIRLNLIFNNISFNKKTGIFDIRYKYNKFNFGRKNSIKFKALTFGKINISKEKYNARTLFSAKEKSTILYKQMGGTFSGKLLDKLTVFRERFWAFFFQVYKIRQYRRKCEKLNKLKVSRILGNRQRSKSGTFLVYNQFKIKVNFRSKFLQYFVFNSQLQSERFTTLSYKKFYLNYIYSLYKSTLINLKKNNTPEYSLFFKVFTRKYELPDFKSPQDYWSVLPTPYSYIHKIRSITSVKDRVSDFIVDRFCNYMPKGGKFFDSVPIIGSDSYSVVDSKITYNEDFYKKDDDLSLYKLEDSCLSFFLEKFFLEKYNQYRLNFLFNYLYSNFFSLLVYYRSHQVSYFNLLSLEDSFAPDESSFVFNKMDNVFLLFLIIRIYLLGLMLRKLNILFDLNITEEIGNLVNYYDFKYKNTCNFSSLSDVHSYYFWTKNFFFDKVLPQSKASLGKQASPLLYMTKNMYKTFCIIKDLLNIKYGLKSDKSFIDFEEINHLLIIKLEYIFNKIILSFFVQDNRIINFFLSIYNNILVIFSKYIYFSYIYKFIGHTYFMNFVLFSNLNISYNLKSLYNITVTNQFYFKFLRYWGRDILLYLNSVKESHFIKLEEVHRDTEKFIYGAIARKKQKDAKYVPTIKEWGPFIEKAYVSRIYNYLFNMKHREYLSEIFPRFSVLREDTIHPLTFYKTNRTSWDNLKMFYMLYNIFNEYGRFFLLNRSDLLLKIAYNYNLSYNYMKDFSTMVDNFFIWDFFSFFSLKRSFFSNELIYYSLRTNFLSEDLLKKFTRGRKVHRKMDAFFYLDGFRYPFNNINYVDNMIYNSWIFSYFNLELNLFKSRGLCNALYSNKNISFIKNSSFLVKYFNAYYDYSKFVNNFAKKNINYKQSPLFRSNVSSFINSNVRELPTQDFVSFYKLFNFFFSTVSKRMRHIKSRKYVLSLLNASRLFSKNKLFNKYIRYFITRHSSSFVNENKMQLYYLSFFNLYNGFSSKEKVSLLFPFVKNSRNRFYSSTIKNKNKVKLKKFYNIRTEPAKKVINHVNYKFSRKLVGIFKKGLYKKLELSRQNQYSISIINNYLKSYKFFGVFDIFLIKYGNYKKYFHIFFRFYLYIFKKILYNYMVLKKEPVSKLAVNTRLNPFYGSLYEYLFFRFNNIFYTFFGVSNMYRLLAKICWNPLDFLKSYFILGFFSKRNIQESLVCLKGFSQEKSRVNFKVFLNSLDQHGLFFNKKFNSSKILGSSCRVGEVFYKDKSPCFVNYFFFNKFIG